MNTRDPFGLHHKLSVLSILQTRVSVAADSVGADSAAALSRQTLEASKQAIQTGKQAPEGPGVPPDGMSFSLPNNIPSFTNPQRRFEDSRWGSSGAVHGQRSSAVGNRAVGSAGNGLGGYFKDKDLPLYKDKPFTYASSRRKRSLWRRKRVFAGAMLFLGLLYWLGLFSDMVPKRSGWSKTNQRPKAMDWDGRRERVKEAFIESWEAYESYAWGYDEFHPISKSGRQMVPKGLGWIIVDSLDTMMLMNLTQKLSSAREWISTSLDYDQDHDVNTFETTIRMLGGLLSAHYLSSTFPEMAPLAKGEKVDEDLYLEKATDLADRLLGAYESPSGIPYASINLKTMEGILSHSDAGASSTAEAGTLQLEMKYVAKLTGEKSYWDKAEKVMQVIDDNAVKDGLVPIFIYATTGQFRDSTIRLGSRGDSYYEYLIKQYLQTSEQEPIYRDMYDQALNGVRKHLVTYSTPSHHTLIGELPGGIGGHLSPKMDHLVCFMPGTIALGATGGLTEKEARKLSTWGKKQEDEMKLARELMQTCFGMYRVTLTGLAPEITWFHIDDQPLHEGEATPPDGLTDETDADWKQDYIVKAEDSHNLQRPETVESLFMMWRITGDIKYREWGWEIFEAFEAYSRENHGAGFVSLNNVNELPPSQRDNMESFWLAETLKYLYLLFSPNDILPLDKVVFNTEAHPLPRFELGNLFSTGWKRKPRGKDGNLISSAKETEAAKGTGEGTK
ncbi:MAG: mannosyl-oligosaccharide alpha-1,2-mannosidase [Geoglossum umbratile]|nr:MAG: mannosyl-oligosaccharide alpha-1,2-mannosidase [Geoglossum umbratile]